MNDTENLVEETRDVSILALIGGGVGLFSPLAMLSSNLLFIPTIAAILLLVALLRITIHRAPMIGGRFAQWCFLFTLFFGSMAWGSAISYRQCEVESAKHFASQWFTLMTTGRPLEALQLETPSLQRAKGAGLLRRYTTERSYMDSHKVFMENDAVKYILREFQGGEITFKRVSDITFSRRLTSFFVIFELSTGEGVMRKSREFQIQISAAKTYADSASNPSHEDRYEWTTRLIDVLPN
ncbi:MAG: hypothetical protein Q4C70_05750 [Planctomycetia bacterium]|nr:hypothetical protein [Planctomycetia bacterium]